MFIRYVILYFLSVYAVAMYSFPEVGMKAVNFSLQNADGKVISLAKYAGDIIVLEWHDPSCVFVKKHYDSGKMQELQKNYAQDKGVVWFQIVVNDANIQNNPYITGQLIDYGEEVSSLYQITKAPTIIIINKKGYIAYIGAVDSLRTKLPEDAWKAKINYIDLSLSALIRNLTIRVPKTRPYGCRVSVPAVRQFG